MQRVDRIVMAMCLVSLVFVGSLVFIESLPMWCANPSGHGNWLIMGMCKG